MDFTQRREGFSEEDDEMMMTDKGKHPFSYSSSCSSYDQMSLGPMSSWLGSNSHHNNNTSGDGTTKLELMESTTVSQDQSDDNNNNSNASFPLASFAAIEKEHMFDKVVTPSDVGKLNRLVIPKQHAEKYFPLDASTNEKGLLLNFEDRNGKPWRFRYSYWNSSQSYVMTKGWSRFVKDKKLDAGDIVSFQRGVGELGKDKLFIDWRRRPDGLPHHPHHHQPTSLPIFGLSHSHHQYPIHRSIPWSPLLSRPPGPRMAAGSLHSSHFNSINNVNMYPYRSSNAYSGASSTNLYSEGNNVFYIRPALPALQWQQGGGSGDGGAMEPMVFDSVPVVQGKAAAKRLRLFGVNMDCPISDDQDDDDDDDDVLLSNTIQHATIAPQASQLSSYSNSSLQLRLYSGTPLQADFQDKRKAPSSSSLDIDM